MTMLTARQEMFASFLEHTFTEDIFVGMLSPKVIRHLARGFAFGLPLDRLAMATTTRTPEELSDYLRPYMQRVWAYFPISNILSLEFKDQVLALVGATVAEAVEAEAVAI